MKANRKSGRIDPVIFNLSNRRVSVVTFTPGRFTSGAF